MTYERFYTEDEKNKAAEVSRQKFSKNLWEKGVQIIENNVKIYDNEPNCIVEGHLDTEEAIGSSQPITAELPETKTEETIDLDERSGNNN